MAKTRPSSLLSLPTSLLRNGEYRDLEDFELTDFLKSSKDSLTSVTKRIRYFTSNPPLVLRCLPSKTRVSACGVAFSDKHMVDVAEKNFPRLSFRMFKKPDASKKDSPPATVKDAIGSTWHCFWTDNAEKKPLDSEAITNFFRRELPRVVPYKPKRKALDTTLSEGDLQPAAKKGKKEDAKKGEEAKKSESSTPSAVVPTVPDNDAAAALLSLDHPVSFKQKNRY